MWGMTLKSMSSKRPSKHDREQAVLLGLVELYLQTGEPIGSNTLKDEGFGHLSSATIRNYFAKLEKEGYLMQQHSSGGRLPTDKALRAYVDDQLKKAKAQPKLVAEFEQELPEENREIVMSLHKMADRLSELTNCAVFLSSPRFDQDFIQSVKLVSLDATSLLAVIITDFGLIRTETIYGKRTVCPELLTQIEQYFLWRLSKAEKPQLKNEAEFKLAQKIYNEVMVRHVVDYVNFSHEDLYKTGLSKLLNYPEFAEPEVLTSSLSLFENPDVMHHLLMMNNENSKTITCWIGEELKKITSQAAECSLLTISYSINETSVGAIALLGPKRLPYAHLFSALESFASVLSEYLTKNVSKFKITYRQPAFSESSQVIHKSQSFLLEDQSQ